MTDPKEAKPVQAAVAHQISHNNKNIDCILKPLIDHCKLDASSVIEEQELLMILIDKVHKDLQAMSGTGHFKSKDDEIVKHLDKVMLQSERLNGLKGKLDVLQKRLMTIENSYKKLKEEIPELKKHSLLIEEKKKPPTATLTAK